MSVRIAKYLASCGLGSRRKCEEIIAFGKVTVNGTSITSPALNVSPDSDVIKLSGKKLEPQKKMYYLVNKPVGYTCSLADEHAKKLVVELVPDNELVWPVGRLDRDTSGLIILCNDGDLTQHLTHPKYEKSKTYIATLDKELTSEEYDKLALGIELEDGRLKPDALRSLGHNQYEITVHEGRNRLVRRIFEHFGREVKVLDRTRLAFLEKGSLKVGGNRRLNRQEIDRLKHA